MDVRICSEIQTLLKSYIFISSGDITITLFLLELQAMNQQERMLSRLLPSLCLIV